MNIVRSIKRAMLTEERSLDIISPMQGHIFNLDQVPNKTFANKLFGDGVSIIPTGNSVVAPCTGRIGKIFTEFTYSFNIETEEGLELVIHIGEGFNNIYHDLFKCFVCTNQKVETGEPILEFNLPLLRNSQLKTTSPIILSNAERVMHIKKYSGFVEAGIDKIMTVYFV